MNVRIEESWRQILQPEFDKPYFELLTTFVRQQYQTRQCFPPARLIFNAFDSCPFNQVRVVIIGQDPYHDVGQAHGLCFSVKKGVVPPPSLVNIFKELESDCGCEIPSHGYLADWAAQGVLLLNTVLTVRGGQPNSHKGMGWEIYTDNVIRKLNERSRPMVFMLWGSNARSKKVYLTSPQHLILEAPHPSPLSAYRGFFGCGHFSKANRFLAEHGMEPVDWQLR